MRARSRTRGAAGCKLEWDPNVWVDDWLPALKRAASWNAWSKTKTLIKLVGCLRGWALQEWNLIEWSQLETGSNAMAAQEFQHGCLTVDESLADFIHRLKTIFCVAYVKKPIMHYSMDNTMKAFCIVPCRGLLAVSNVSTAEGLSSKLYQTKQRKHWPKRFKDSINQDGAEWLSTKRTVTPYDPMQYLLSYSDSSEDEVWWVCIQDGDSEPYCARVNVQGVLMEYVVNSGASITIMDGTCSSMWQ